MLVGAEYKCPPEPVSRPDWPRGDLSLFEFYPHKLLPRTVLSTHTVLSLYSTHNLWLYKSRCNTKNVLMVHIIQILLFPTFEEFQSQASEVWSPLGLVPCDQQCYWPLCQFVTLPLHTRPNQTNISCNHHGIHILFSPQMSYEACLKGVQKWHVWRDWCDLGKAPWLQKMCFQF